MTDILEQLAEQPADQLWEAVRRERGLPAPYGANHPGGGKDGEEALPLRAALTRLERQRAGTLRLTREEGRRELRRTAAPFEPSVGDERMGGRSIPLSAGTEDLLQGAEGLDRIFRRDGRRYDGGFFLY